MSEPKRIEGGHDWAPDPDEAGDSIDIFAFEVETHNGPRCRRCGLADCHHCKPGIYDERCPSGQLEIV